MNKKGTAAIIFLSVIALLAIASVVMSLNTGITGAAGKTIAKTGTMAQVKTSIPKAADVRILTEKGQRIEDLVAYANSLEDRIYELEREIDQLNDKVQDLSECQCIKVGTGWSWPNLSSGYPSGTADEAIQGYVSCLTECNIDCNKDQTCINECIEDECS